MSPRSLSQLLLRTAAAGLVAASLVPAQTPSYNAKVFFTEFQTQSGRETDDQVDTLYQMPDREFRRGSGTATGFSAVLQDEEQSTSEYVQFGIVKASGPETPDVTQAGEIVNLGVTLFGVNSGRASYTWTITLQNPVTVPGDAGVRLILPRPRNKQVDMCTVHYRPGNQLAMAANAPVRTYAHVLQSSTAMPWFSARSTFHAGLLYDEPVTLLSVRTHKSAYGSEATLIGPESVHVDAKRGDRAGWDFVADAFRPQGTKQTFAIPLIGTPASTPIPTPWGELLLAPPTLLALQPLALTALGTGSTGHVPLPAGLQLTTQALFVEVDFAVPTSPVILRVQLSDATGFRSW